jgi:hypothetical protein
VFIWIRWATLPGISQKNHVSLNICLVFDDVLSKMCMHVGLSLCSTCGVRLRILAEVEHLTMITYMERTLYIARSK